MTSNRVLLVEGATDKAAFRVLFKGEPGCDAVVIDTASLIESPPELQFGNREKVEWVASEAQQTDVADRFLGFVDREYRGFVESPFVRDAISDHKIIERIVWSRGHSIENYCFDIDILEVAFRICTVSDSLAAAFRRFKAGFVSCMTQACALGLAARDSGLLSVITATFDWTSFQLRQTGELSIDISRWADKADKTHHLPPDKITEFSDRFSHWLKLLEEVDQETVRWLCHGHVGFKIIWSAYTMCLFESSGQDRSQIKRLLGVHNDVRFNSCLEGWKGVSTSGEWPGPEPVLALLGLAGT